MEMTYIAAYSKFLKKKPKPILTGNTTKGKKNILELVGSKPLRITDKIISLVTVTEGDKL